MANHFLMQHEPLEEGDVRISQNNILFRVFRTLVEEESVPETVDENMMAFVGGLAGGY